MSKRSRWEFKPMYKGATRETWQAIFDGHRVGMVTVQRNAPSPDPLWRPSLSVDVMADDYEGYPDQILEEFNKWSGR